MDESADELRILVNATRPSGKHSRRLDVYLENTMCDITKVVWGCPQGEAMSWSVAFTLDSELYIGKPVAFTLDSELYIGKPDPHSISVIIPAGDAAEKVGLTGSFASRCWDCTKNSSRAELFDISNSADREVAVGL
ncbi:hypothetical protein AK812_SmicGene78 [Symbiodinium microadriaticum]|uniref:Uncharacterized protein n=1 Tax=Symbiodinium microadriaticum TaxID=2951 RepID=A0A1Q9F7Q1_SYMMI|nr:hypothetical protein AK812_SmicGene78 [Symbiodinium microadriaticum]